MKEYEFDRRKWWKLVAIQLYSLPACFLAVIPIAYYLMEGDLGLALLTDLKFVTAILAVYLSIVILILPASRKIIVQLDEEKIMLTENPLGGDQTLVWSEVRRVERREDPAGKPYWLKLCADKRPLRLWLLKDMEKLEQDILARLPEGVPVTEKTSGYDFFRPLHVFMLSAANIFLLSIFSLLAIGFIAERYTATLISLGMLALALVFWFLRPFSRLIESARRLEQFLAVSGLMATLTIIYLYIIRD